MGSDIWLPATLAVGVVTMARESVRVGRLSITAHDRSSVIPTLTAALDKFGFKISDSMGGQLRFQSPRRLMGSEITATLSNDGSMTILGPTATLSALKKRTFPAAALEPKVGVLPKRKILAISAMWFIMWLILVAFCQTLISLV